MSNCFSINHFYKTVDNKAIEFPLHLTDLTFNWFNCWSRFSSNFITYCQQNWCVWLAIYIDLFSLRTFEQEEDHYKPLTVGNFWSNNYIQYESGDRCKTLSLEKYLNKIRPYLKDIINLKKSDTRKIQLTTTINCTSSKDHFKECEPPTKVSKRGGGGLDRTSTFREGLLGRRGWLFSVGVAIFT